MQMTILKSLKEVNQAFICTFCVFNCSVVQGTYIQNQNGSPKKDGLEPLDQVREQTRYFGGGDWIVIFLVFGGERYDS